MSARSTSIWALMLRRWATGGAQILVEALMMQGYDQCAGFRCIQLVRMVPATEGGPPIDIVVDFLMSRDAEIVKNSPLIIANFAVQRAYGADLAFRLGQLVATDGTMPNGWRNKEELVVVRFRPCWR